ncbi:glycosyltransferase family 4 protein [Ruegeria arenilitoris]|uniref:glycosyltransferase family 4 protein n=1 Tax=Ruegeria arenilitoris TaxID=1173585 RepID=UPI00147AEF93|nr:glycosyltransferase family 4 protein [Ruegeria arenilitoris]
MKIIHVITCLLNGGSEENTIATCNAQAERGHEVWLLYGQECDSERKSTISGKVKTQQIQGLVRELSPIRDLRAFSRICGAIRQISPNVIHTHASKAGILGRAAAWRCRTPIVLHGVHILPFLNVSPVKRIVYLSLEKLVALNTDAYIAVSQGMHDANLKAGLGKAENNFVVYSGMDLDRFRRASALDQLPKGRVLIMAASLEPRKRHLEFISVFARLVKKHPDLHLYLVGQGECENAIRESVDQYGLRQHVHLVGFQKNVEQYIASADICVLASMREGLPRVLVQYVAAGKPMVVTWLPGIEEIVRDGSNGLVVETGSVAEMQRHLDQLLTDAEMLETMTSCARQFDTSKWSLDAMEPKVEAVINKVALRKGIPVNEEHALSSLETEAEVSR